MGMATLQPQTSVKSPPAPPASTQPGGGFFMKLELFWGQWRRAWLRLFRPGYVRRMADNRLGQCPNCRHHIVDPRDLKYYRNVCGYYFREEDDPFRWRDELGFARAGLAEVCCVSVVSLLIIVYLLYAVNMIHSFFWLGIPIVLLVWLSVLYFFRDPDRTLPTDPSALLSPADGTVTHVEEVREPDFPGGRALRISIFLSLWNVHVNRIPRTSQVVGLRYFPGKFQDARQADSAAHNEQLWIDLEESNPPRRLRVKQIAGKLARRIFCRLKMGESVMAGDRFGMIKFGSRTEVLLPVGEAVELLVRVGDRVKGGSSALLRFAKPGE